VRKAKAIIEMTVNLKMPKREETPLKSRIGTLKKGLRTLPKIKREESKETELLGTAWEICTTKGIHHSDNWCSWKKIEQLQRHEKESFIKTKGLNFSLKECLALQKKTEAESLAQIHASEVVVQEKREKYNPNETTRKKDKKQVMYQRNKSCHLKFSRIFTERRQWSGVYKELNL
jgi:hypothetical protein